MFCYAYRFIVLARYETASRSTDTTYIGKIIKHFILLVSVPIKFYSIQNFPLNNCELLYVF